MTEIQYTNMAIEPHFTETDVRVLRFLIKNINEEFSIKAIAERIDKTYPIVWERVIKLNQEQIINIREINPKQNLCALNLKNSDIINVLSFIEFIEKDDFFSRKARIKAIADDIMKNIDGNSFTFMIFGSVAKEKERKPSDIDVIFLVPSMDDESRINTAVKSAERLTTKNVHAVVMTYTDFFKSLGEEKPNLASEVIENHIMVYGGEAYYRDLIRWKMHSV